MFNGKKINSTEKRAVLHTALRAKKNDTTVDGHNYAQDIANVLAKMQQFTSKVHQGQFRGYTGKKIDTIINIGIGGSDLGPALVCQALKSYRQADMKIHFVSSVDGAQIFDILSQINPETSLFVIASKTFTTQETITNANTAKEWLLNKFNGDIKAISQHFVAVSTNQSEVCKFGIDTNNMFEFWDFVGGRYSLWSAIGLAIILYIGFDNYQQLLNGANTMDEHFLNTKMLDKNLPVVMGLIGIWNINFNQYLSLIISPYNTSLSKLPAYIQQLAMESNGKSVNKDGEPLNYNTCPIIWGDSGINGQHAYYQLLHQGTQIVPIDIIIALTNKSGNQLHQDILLANAIAQAEAFMWGRNYSEAFDELLAQGMDTIEASKLAKHKIFNGNRPSNMVVIPEINPYYLGMLIALYEHVTFVQGVIWNINSFDQMGVELGKKLAKVILNDIQTKNISSHDSSTTNLIQIYTASR